MSAEATSVAHVKLSCQRPFARGHNEWFNLKALGRAHRRISPHADRSALSREHRQAFGFTILLGSDEKIQDIPGDVSLQSRIPPKNA